MKIQTPIFMRCKRKFLNRPKELFLFAFREIFLAILSLRNREKINQYLALFFKYLFLKESIAVVKLVTINNQKIMSRFAILETQLVIFYYN